MRDMYNNIPGFSVDELSPEDDPFYDPAPWFQFIGRSYVYLQNILHGVPLSHVTPIFSQKSDIKGHLKVQIIPVSISDEEKSDVSLKNFSQVTTVDLSWKHLDEKYIPLVNNTQIEDEAHEAQKLDSKESILYFNIVLEEATGLSSKDYTDVFCQIRFLSDQGITFATSPPCKGIFFFFLFSFFFFLFL